MAYHWAQLPPAIICLILKHVAQETASHHTLAQYAAVNRDWQYVFEQLTFRSLILGPDDLPKFESIVSTHSERRKWLRVVSFHDFADGGAHLDGGLEELLPERTLSQAVCSLLHLLKKWDRDADLRLVLRLSAPVVSSLGGQRGAALHPSPASLPSTNMPRHPEKDGLSHIIGEILAVKGFAIQYHEEKPISPRTIISLCPRLPELEELCLQDLGHHNADKKHWEIAELTPQFPKNLKRLHVLGQGGKGSKSACRFLVQRLAWFGMTTPLQELSITTSGHAAEEFFENLKNLATGSSASGTCYWPALQSLTLACSLLEPGAPHSASNRLLHQAGMMALGLPRLRGLRLLSYSTRRKGKVDGFFHYVAKEKGRDTATCSGESAQHSPRVCLTCRHR